MKYGTVTAVALVAAILGVMSPVHADPLQNKSPAEALAFHDFRMRTFPKLYDAVTVAASGSPRALIRNATQNAVVDKMLKTTDLLSVMKYRNGEIVVDGLSKKMAPKDKMYSMSVFKSLIGYLVGHAVCEGRFESLSDPLERYLPESKGTFYGTVSLQNMINMAAGDRAIWRKEIRPTKYSNLVLVRKPDKRKTVLEMLQSIRPMSHSDLGTFHYSSIITDLIGKALDNVTPNGLAAYLHDKLAEPSGNADSMFFLIDKNGWPISHAFLYATRDDYVRMAIRIREDWNAATCIGDYLRAQYEGQIRTGMKGIAAGYGSFFWFGPKTAMERTVAFIGVGGQRAIINLENGTILFYHAIRDNFDKGALEKALLKEAHQHATED